MPSPGSTLPEVLTEVLPIRPLFAPYLRGRAARKLPALKTVLVNHNTDSTPATIFKTAPHTAPRRSTCASAPAPTTSAGRESVKSTAEPTGTSASMRNKTPLAEMFSVSIVFPETSCPVTPDWLTADVDFSATGSFMGKRG